MQLDSSQVKICWLAFYLVMLPGPSPVNINNTVCKASVVQLLRLVLTKPAGLCSHVHCGGAGPGTVVHMTAGPGTVVHMTAGPGTVVHMTAGPGTVGHMTAGPGTVVHVTDFSH